MPAYFSKPSVADLPTLGYVRQSQLIPGIVPFSPATLWRKVADGSFPKSVKLSVRITAWEVAAVCAWLANPSGYRA
jgi:predicted DNA-binding transcriptional regulator AlpA